MEWCWTQQARSDMSGQAAAPPATNARIAEDAGDQAGVPGVSLPLGGHPAQLATPW